MDTKNRRLRGPHVVIAFLVLASIGTVGGWLVLRQHPEPAAIIDVLNLDGERAVLVREVRGPDDRSFLSLFERDHGERWGALIPRYVGSGARTAVAATEDVVMVRGNAGGQAAFFAFSGKTGHKLGRIEPFLDARQPADTGFVLARGPSLSDRGQVFELSGVPGEWLSILAFAVQDGTLTWHAVLDANTLERVWLTPDHLVVQTADRLFVLERTTGQVSARMPATDPACVLDDLVYTRPLAGHARLAGLCGRTDSHTLFAVHDDQGAAILAFDPSGAEAWRVPIPGSEPAASGDATFRLDEVALVTPASAPFAGQLTRFVPVLVSTASGDRLLVIDTRSARVARSGRASPWLAHARLMSAGGHHYLYLPGRGMLAVMDGDTGEFGRVRTLEGWSGIWPRQVAGGRIWITRGHQWAVLDALTLEPLPGAGVTRLDPGDGSARDALIAELGI